MRVDIFLHLSPDAERLLFDYHRETLAAIHNAKGALMSLADDIKAEVDDLNTKMAAEKTVTDSVVTFVNGLKQQIADLSAQLSTAGTDTAKLTEVKAGLDALSSAIDANTVAENAVAGTATPPGG